MCFTITLNYYAVCHSINNCLDQIRILQQVWRTLWKPELWHLLKLRFFTLLWFGSILSEMKSLAHESTKRNFSLLLIIVRLYSRSTKQSCSTTRKQTTCSTTSIHSIALSFVIFILVPAFLAIVCITQTRHSTRVTPLFNQSILMTLSQLGLRSSIFREGIARILIIRSWQFFFLA